LRFPSWNLPDIFAGMATDFPDDFAAQYPYAERGEPYDYPVTLHGGSVSMVRIAAPAPGTALIRVTGQDGSPAPAGVVLRIVRLK
jgi:hypothetical protein